MADSEPQSQVIKARDPENTSERTLTYRPKDVPMPQPIEDEGGFFLDLLEGVGNVFTPDDRASKMIGDMPEGLSLIHI